MLQQNTRFLFHVFRLKIASTANRTSSCSTAQFWYSPLFIQFLFHHVSPPGWHRGQTGGLFLSLHVDTGVKGNMGGNGSPCSSVKDLNYQPAATHPTTPPTYLTTFALKSFYLKTFNESNAILSAIMCIKSSSGTKKSQV